tara:strand:+ start:4136 stop:4429 length:294 start_codon:yes stop_codon:yes gene_type:complete
MPSYNNHLKVGYREVIHRNKKVASSLNAPDFKTFLDSLDEGSYRVGVIPPGFEHRADRISDLFYETPNLDWLICWINNVSDPFQQLNVGDRIRILDL